jgi:hypothetical protein
VLSTFTTAGARTSGLIAGKATLPESDAAEDLAVGTYPNPANTQFVIQLKGSIPQGTASLWLRDMTGKAVWSKQQVQIDALKGMPVDVSKLAPGMYLLQILDEDGETVAVKKIIVSR